MALSASEVIEQRRRAAAGGSPEQQRAIGQRTRNDVINQRRAQQAGSPGGKGGGGGGPGGLYSGINPDGSRRTQQSGWANPGRFQWNGPQDQALFDNRRGAGGGPAHAPGSPEWKRLIQMSMAGGGEQLGQQYNRQQQMGGQPGGGYDRFNPMHSANPNQMQPPQGWTNPMGQPAQMGQMNQPAQGGMPTDYSMPAGGQETLAGLGGQQSMQQAGAGMLPAQDAPGGTPGGMPPQQPMASAQPMGVPPMQPMGGTALDSGMGPGGGPDVAAAGQQDMGGGGGGGVGYGGSMPGQMGPMSGTQPMQAYGAEQLGQQAMDTFRGKPDGSPGGKPWWGGGNHPDPRQPGQNQNPRNAMQQAGNMQQQMLGGIGGMGLGGGQFGNSQFGYQRAPSPPRDGKGGGGSNLGAYSGGGGRNLGAYSGGGKGGR